MPDTGLVIPAWSGRRAQDALAWVRQQHRPGGPLAANPATGTPCCLCRQRIDYDSRGMPDSLTVQHIRKRQHYPHLTWDRNNWAPAHASCNYSDNTSTSTPSLGLTSE